MPSQDSRAREVMAVIAECLAHQAEFENLKLFSAERKGSFVRLALHQHILVHPSHEGCTGLRWLWGNAFGQPRCRTFARPSLSKLKEGLKPP